MTEQKYYDALTQQEVTEDFIKAQYEELTSKGDYFHDTYENFKNNNFKKIDTEAMSWEQQPKTVTLTNELCSTLQCYILMTTKHREGELKHNNRDTRQRQWYYRLDNLEHNSTRRGNNRSTRGQQQYLEREA